MVMGILLSVGGIFLYWMLKPPVDDKFSVQREKVFATKPLVEFKN